jgi:integrase
MIKRVDREDGTRWQVYGKRKGKKVYLGTFSSPKLARAADEDHRAQQRKIAAGELPPDFDAKRTLGASIQSWLTALRAAGSRSADEYESRARNHILPTLGGVLIADIHKPDVVRFRDALSSKLSAATTTTVMTALSSAFNWFVDQRWLERNPCHGVKALTHPTKLFPWLTSYEQITRLLGECTPNICSLVAVLVGTGMRLDEALHLRWDDIDLDHRIITVHRGRRGVTKSGKGRHVPILDNVLPVLKQMRLARGTNVLLWPGRSPTAALSQPSVRYPFKRAVDHAGLPPQLRLHDLRHTFASLWLIDGGDIFKLSRILGHSSVTITERTYAHLKPDAYDQDYGRVAFRMPSVGAVLRLAE